MNDRGNRLTNRDRMRNEDRMKTRVIAILLALGAAACQRDQEDAEGLRAVERDSAGIRIVENERPPEGSRLGWRIGPEPAVSIGQREGEEPYMLHRVFAATKLSDGRIVVANSGSSDLRVFDASGTHLATWGGQGEGPGEFWSLGAVFPWPGDSIIAWYSQGFGLSVFDSRGSFGRSFSLESGEGVSWLLPRPVWVRENGTILAMIEPESSDTAVIEIRDGHGALSASLGAHPSGEPVRITWSGRPALTWVLYGRKLVTGLWRDLVVVSPTTRYEIRAFREDGALARIVRRDHLPRTPTQADFDFHVERELSQASQDLLQYRSEQLRSTPLATTFPAFSSTRGDAAGNLWVRDYDLPREKRPAPLWTVFDPEGRVLGFVETPEGLMIYEIGEDYLLGRTTDDLGVEYIQMWPLERSEG